MGDDTKLFSVEHEQRLTDLLFTQDGKSTMIASFLMCYEEATWDTAGPSIFVPKVFLQDVNRNWSNLTFETIKNKITFPWPLVALGDCIPPQSKFAVKFVRKDSSHIQSL